MRNRKHIRLYGFDYSSMRYYFVTMKVKSHICYFGSIIDKSMHLSGNGVIAMEQFGAYKTTVSKRIHHNGNMGFKWQNSFHDHIIRNKQELNRIIYYIEKNPENWDCSCSEGSRPFTTLNPVPKFG